MGKQGRVLLENELNEVITSSITYSLSLNELTPLIIGKCSLLECSNCIGIMLIRHT